MREGMDNQRAGVRNETETTSEIEDSPSVIALTLFVILTYLSKKGRKFHRSSLLYMEVLYSRRTSSDLFAPDLSRQIQCRGSELYQGSPAATF